MRLLMRAPSLPDIWLAHQMGFSYGATVDPQSGVRSTMLATLYGSLATLAFLGINGHHMLLRALTASYQGVPIGAGQIRSARSEDGQRDARPRLHHRRAPGAPRSSSSFCSSNWRSG
jgi:flagellar biosynthetic protein FliR